MSDDLPEPFGILYKPAPEFDVDAPEEETAALMLLEPAFNGIVFRYNTIKMNEDKTAGEAVLNYDYTLVKGEVPENNKVEFELVLGNLLYDILLERMTLTA